MELIETLQGQANSIASNGAGHIPEKSSTKRRLPQTRKQESQKRKKARSPAGTKLAAASGAK